MAEQKGSDFKLYIQDASAGSPTSFLQLAGLRSKNFQLNGEMVDVTNADQTTKWRKLLAGAGIKNMSVTGQMVFTDAAVDMGLVNEFINQAHLEWQIEVPNFAIFQGKFQLNQLGMAGEHNGEVTMEVTIESADEIVKSAI